MRMSALVGTLLKSRRGSTSVIIICTTFIVLLAAALVTDIAYAAAEKYKLAKAAREIAGLGAVELENGRITAEKVMRENSVLKIGDLTELDIKISQTNKEITVNMGKPFEYIFLQYAGFKKSKMTRSVTAKLSGIAEFKGIRPFAVQKQSFEYGKKIYLTNMNIKRADTIIFKEVDLGLSDYRTSVLYGYRKSLNTGSGIYPLHNASTEETVEYISRLIDKCRHQPACSSKDYQKDCTRMIILPVVDMLEQDSKKTMEIEGFAAFFVESVRVENQRPVLQGSFVRHIINSRVNDAAEEYGLLGLELIN